eukprot:scaffold126109_cov41-Tisochrysis_lutea.AAC.1
MGKTQQLHTAPRHHRARLLHRTVCGIVGRVGLCRFLRSLIHLSVELDRNQCSLFLASYWARGNLRFRKPPSGPERLALCK